MVSAFEVGQLHPSDTLPGGGGGGSQTVVGRPWSSSQDIKIHFGLQQFHLWWHGLAPPGKANQN